MTPRYYYLRQVSKGVYRYLFAPMGLNLTLMVRYKYEY